MFRVHYIFSLCHHVYRLTILILLEFNIASDLGKSRWNEKRIHKIATARGVVTVTQIAGFLTRCIDSWVVEGQQVAAGQPLGFIHLGSRVDIRLPKPLQLHVQPGGRQIIASYGDF